MTSTHSPMASRKYAANGAAKFTDKHLASTIHCVDDEIFGWPACPHQKNRIDPSYPHPRILLRQLDSHKLRKAAIFRGALISTSAEAIPSLSQRGPARILPNGSD